ncbi:MAG: phospholipid carrier-dependent glycosyltransferase, partial [Candidatus Andersenbacteria bacterium]
MKEQVQAVSAWVKKYRLDIGVSLFLLLVAGLPRLLDLGVFLTADEKNWIGRSYEFIRAFKDFRFNDMMQTTHPGVTTMWLSGFAITLKMYLSHIPFSFRNLAHFAAAAQFPIALTITLTFPLMYWWLKRLLHSRQLAVFASLLIALDPFLIGYSRVVHVDALVSHLLFLAVLATLLYAREQFSRQWLVISAVATAVSILTKAPAIFMLPFLLLVMSLQLRGTTLSRPWVQERLRDLVIWLLIIGLLFVIFWPAILWVPDPEGNLLLIKRDLSIAAVTPHHMIEDYSLSPLHYVYTLITRTTPVIQLGLIASLVFAIFSWITKRKRQQQSATTISADQVTGVMGRLAAY